MRKPCLQINEFGGMGVLKKHLQMIAELLWVYISQLDLEYMMVSNYSMT